MQVEKPSWTEGINQQGFSNAPTLRNKVNCSPLLTYTSANREPSQSQNINLDKAIFALSHYHVSVFHSEDFPKKTDVTQIKSHHHYSTAENNGGKTGWKYFQPNWKTKGDEQVEHHMEPQLLVLRLPINSEKFYTRQWYSASEISDKRTRAWWICNCGHSLWKEDSWIS